MLFSLTACPNVSRLAFLAPSESAQVSPPAKTSVSFAEGDPLACPSLHSGCFLLQLLSHELLVLVGRSIGAPFSRPRNCGLYSQAPDFLALY